MDSNFTVYLERLSVWINLMTDYSVISSYWTNEGADCSPVNLTSNGLIDSDLY